MIIRILFVEMWHFSDVLMILLSISKPGRVDILISCISALAKTELFLHLQIIWVQTLGFFIAYSTTAICHTDYHSRARTQSASRVLKLFSRSSAQNLPFSKHFLMWAVLVDIIHLTKFSSLFSPRWFSYHLLQVALRLPVLWEEKPRPQAHYLQHSHFWGSFTEQL